MMSERPPGEPAGGTPGAPDEEPWLPEFSDEHFGPSSEFVEAVEEAVDAENVERVRQLLEDLHAADAADLIETLGREERRTLIDLLDQRLDPEILAYLDPAVREEVIECLGPAGLARALSTLDSDDAVAVFEDLPEDFQHRILAALPQAYRHILTESLTYPEESAGRLMQREYVAIPSAWTVGETIDYMRNADDLPENFYDLFVVDPRHHPIGSVPVSRVLRTRRPGKLTEIMDRDLDIIPLTMDQEEVAYLFRQYGLVSAPVVDEAGRLVGVITVDDVVDIVSEEAEEDLLKLGGVRVTDLYSDVLATTKARFTWLVVNLFTAVLASGVISLFEDTIDRLVALAVLMPIVASMGGNAGTQTLTVAVRALALKDLAGRNARRYIGKELLVGVINGVLFAILCGGVAWAWFGSLELGVVIGAAMIVNMAVAGLSGALIPLGLEKLGIDPANASSVFLTTMTDVVGFFAFLGLAAIFLL